MILRVRIQVVYYFGLFPILVHAIERALLCQLLNFIFEFDDARASALIYSESKMEKIFITCTCSDLQLFEYNRLHVHVL